MRLPSWTISLLAALSLLVAACGSVATRPVETDGGAGGTGAAGSGAGASGGSGSGGATGTGGTATGGKTGSTGGAGGAAVDAGPDGPPSDGPSIIARGAIIPFGILAPATGATVHVTHQRFGPTFACSGNVCFSGGLLPASP